MIIANIMQEFLGRRLLRVFTSYDRDKIGFEFEQLSTLARYRYIFDISGTIDRSLNLDNILGRRITAVIALESLEESTGQEKLVIYTNDPVNPWTVLFFSRGEEVEEVELVYDAREIRKAPYATRLDEYIVQEDDFDYGPTASAIPPVETFYILLETGDKLLIETGDGLLQEVA